MAQRKKEDWASKSVQDNCKGCGIYFVRSQTLVLRWMSQGRAIYMMQFARHEEAPKAVQKQIIEAHKGSKVAA